MVSNWGITQGEGAKVLPKINSTRRQLIVVDDFLENPDEMRELALQQKYKPRHSAGVRSEETFPFFEIYRDCFAELLDEDISFREFCEPVGESVNGCFQWCKPPQHKVIHCDAQRWAGALYLTPDAPVEAGTTLYRHKETKERYDTSPGLFSGGYYDETRWEVVDNIGNIYNRLVLWHGTTVHAASVYFGQEIHDSRLFQVFFFNGRPR